jgi:hypothetical protein
MAPPPPDDRLDQTLDRVLRAFAYLGAVVVAALGFALRTDSGRRAARSLEAGLGRLDRLESRHLPTLATWADRLLALLERAVARWH